MAFERPTWITKGGKRILVGGPKDEKGMARGSAREEALKADRATGGKVPHAEFVRRVEEVNKSYLNDAQEAHKGGVLPGTKMSIDEAKATLSDFATYVDTADEKEKEATHEVLSDYVKSYIQDNIDYGDSPNMAESPTTIKDARTLFKDYLAFASVLTDKDGPGGEPYFPKKGYAERRPNSKSADYAAVRRTREIGRNMDKGYAPKRVR